MIAILVLQGPDRGRRFQFDGGDPIHLGRSSEQVPLTDLTISRNHATLVPVADKWHLRDEGSANGVYVNGEQIKDDVVIKIGDQIRLGATLLVFGASQGSVRVTASQTNTADSDIISSIPSNEDSLILDSPEPTAAAVRHLRTMLQLSNAIGSIYEPEALLQRVLDLLFDQMQIDRGFIALRDAAGQVTPQAVRYRDPKKNAKIVVSHTIIDHVITRQEGVLSSDAMSDRRFSKGKSVHNMAIRSVICAPLRGRHGVLGVIHLDSSVANHTFSEDQLRLVTAIGVQTGMALEHAQLYRDSLKQERLAAVGQTVAALSHSIRNMLQGMRGGADVLHDGIRTSNLEQIRMGWGILERNLDKVQVLTVNMLAYSKPRQPLLQLANLNTILEDIISLTQNTARDRKIELLTEFDEDMPPAPLDPDGIHHAVLNLVTNGMDAVQSGHGVVTVTSKYDPDAQELVVEVQDNGVGIGKSDLAHLFQPFYSTKGQKGTGLGLSVTKKIVEEHGGRIVVDSKLNQGTTFRLHLPIRRTTTQDPGQTQGGPLPLDDSGIE